MSQTVWTYSNTPTYNEGLLRLSFSKDVAAKIPDGVGGGGEKRTKFR